MTSTKQAAQLILEYTQIKLKCAVTEKQEEEALEKKIINRNSMEIIFISSA